MPTPFHNTVSLRGFHFEDSHLTVKLAAGTVLADVGKAISKDGTVVNGFKLAADGDEIVGRLETVENRTVEGQLIGTVSFRFANSLVIKTGETVVVGDTVVGAGAGEVKARKVGPVEVTDQGPPVVIGTGTPVNAPDYSKNIVVEIVGTPAAAGTYAVVLKI